MAERNQSSRNYYWITAIDPETGKPYLIFGGEDETTARNRGLDQLPGIDFKIRKLRTRDIHAASGMIRGKRLERTHSLKRASERLGHEKSANRLRKKRGRGLF